MNDCSDLPFSCLAVLSLATSTGTALSSNRHGDASVSEMESVFFSNLFSAPTHPLLISLITDIVNNL